MLSNQIGKVDVSWPYTVIGYSWARNGIENAHLLRTVIANSDVECIIRAKTLQLNMTGIG